MLHLHRKLEAIANQELIRLDISGLVLGVCFVYNNNCYPMIKIAFCSEIEPKPILTEFDYIEKDDCDDTTWYLYMTIDTGIQVK